MAPAVELKHSADLVVEDLAVERLVGLRRLAFTRARACAEEGDALRVGDRRAGLRARERVLAIDLVEAATEATVIGASAIGDRLMGAYTALRGSAA